MMASPLKLLLLAAVLLAACTSSVHAGEEEVHEVKTAGVEAPEAEPPAPEEHDTAGHESDSDEDSHEDDHDDDHSWSYDGEAGPEKWSHLGYSQCSGQRQSPINVVTNRVIRRHFKPIVFENFNQIPEEMNMTNNFHSAKAALDWERTPKISSGGLPGEYRVINFHFHWGRMDYRGSEHTIDGESYPLEMHIVSQNTKYDELSEALQHPDGLAVMGIMFEVSRANNRAMKRLEPALRRIVKGGASVSVDEPPRLQDLMPWNTNDFYRYDGSLTTPNCNEVVTWTIFLETVKITQKQLELFRALKKNPAPIGRNYRPPQARYGRSVYLSQPEEEEVETIGFAGKTAAVRSGAPALTEGPLAALLTSLLAVRLLF
ncbi:putative carbonic anhydrase 3 [Amphibalanus amphitrite]|uniref:putative carbonic anhydrase 3 n=1 Tax=Amphibalanus amphitrite TaxID=1232801 RepID=UPI001C90E5D4|nr:putative carbonic anhydrase 3 [Amphibalanus amphitrite]